ncbi:MAG: biopolymer transporter ExbD [Pseudomonadota bacterium]
MRLPVIKRKSLVNLTPLIDVVFILLIFFMLASNFIKWHSLELSVTKPEEMQIDHEAISLIRIERNGSYYLNDALLPLDDIIGTVRQQALSNREHPIIIQPEEGSYLQLMVDLLERLQILSDANISLAKPNQN